MLPDLSTSRGSRPRTLAVLLFTLLAKVAALAGAHIRAHLQAPATSLQALIRAPSPWRAALRAALAALGRLLAPDRCAACDGPCPAGEPFCTGCADTVETEAPNAALAADGNAQRVIAACRYEGAIARAIHRLKYSERPDLAAPLGLLLQRASRGLSVDVVVPVPLHPARLRERGYNQSALLAAEVASALGVKLEVRATNTRGAFVVRAPLRVKGRRVLLVDDVHTTGATLQACGDELLLAGAAEVVALVLARTPLPV